MNSLQFGGLLKKNPQIKKIFKKVCALDEIELSSYTSAYVINLILVIKKASTGWLYTLTKTEEENIFDSYGLPPRILDQEDYMNRFLLDWIYNRKTMQSLFSNACRHYCVYFILFYFVVVISLCMQYYLSLP